MKNWIWMILVLTVVLSACGQPSGANSPTGEAGQSLEDTAWVLVSMDTTDSETPVLKDSQVTMKFVDGEASGSAGCNAYGGSYQVIQDKLFFSEMAYTAMACEDQALMDQEAAYLMALQSAGSYELYADRLLIFYGDGLSSLNFIKASE